MIMTMIIKSMMTMIMMMMTIIGPVFQRGRTLPDKSHDDLDQNYDDIDDFHNKGHDYDHHLE